MKWVGVILGVVLSWVIAATFLNAQGTNFQIPGGIPLGTIGQIIAQNSASSPVFVSPSGDVLSSLRAFSDGVENSSTTLTSVTANFVQPDVGSVVSGAGIPNGTTIVSVTNFTTAIMSNAATQNASGVTVMLGSTAGKWWVTGLFGKAFCNTAATAVLNSLQFNGTTWCPVSPIVLNPTQFGAKYDMIGNSASGSTTATSTTFTDAFFNTFLPTDCNVTHGAGCTGTKDKNIVIYEAAKGNDWQATTLYAHGVCIQPTVNNAANTVQCNKTWSSCTSGGAAPAWTQISGTTTDGGCTWQTAINNAGTPDTGLPLTTTIVGFTNANTVTLANQAGFTLNGTATYVYGTDVGPGTNTAITTAAVIAPNGGGIVSLPCTGGMLATELVMSGKGVEMQGCGWGPLESLTGGPTGPGVLWSARTAAIPMLRITASYRPYIHSIRWKGNSAFPPSSVIELCDNGTSADGTVCTASPPNRMVRIDDNLFGNRGPFTMEHDEFAQMTTAIQFVGAADNSPVTFYNDHFNGFTTGAIDEPVTQSVGNVFINNNIISTGGLAKWGIRLGGQGLFDGVTVLGFGAVSSNISGTVFDLINGGDAIVNGLVAEQNGRLLVCDMNGLGTMSSVFRITGKYFQTFKNFTASDGIIVDCGSAAPGGAVVGQQLATFDDLSITDAAGGNAFGQGWQFAYDTTAANSAVKLDIHTNPLGTVPWKNIVATTGSNGSVADVRLDGVDLGQGPRVLRSMAQGPFGKLVYNEEHLNTVQLDAGVSMLQLPSPTTGSPCAIFNSGAATCRYFISTKDSITLGGESLPGGIITCANSAALASQNNQVHIYIVPGADSYNFYGDDCNGGAFKLLSNTTAQNATYVSTGPGNAVCTGAGVPNTCCTGVGTGTCPITYSNQVTLADSAIVRGSVNPPNMNTTGSIANPFNITGIAGFPKNVGDVQSFGHTPGESAFTSLPSYPNQIIIPGTPAVYLKMNDAPATNPLVDSSGNANTCATAGGLTYSQTGPITDDPNKAILFNGTTGTCTVTSSGTMPSGDTVSCAMWAKFTTIPVTRQMFLSQKTGGLQFFVSGTAGIVGSIQLQKDGNQIVGSNGFTINDTNYHYVGFSKNAGVGAAIYIDGANRTQVYSNQTLAPLDATMYVASQSATTNFLGATVSEVACWNTNLTDAQHAALYKEALTQKFGASGYDTTNGCTVFYMANGTWGNGECGLRTVTSGTGNPALPACTAGIAGYHAFITDGNAACTFVGTPTGGGTHLCPVFCGDAAAWLEG